MEKIPPPSENDYNWTSWLSDQFSSIRGSNNGHDHISVPFVLWMFDQQGVFTLCEGEGLSDLGLSTEEMIGKSIFDSISEVPHTLENVRVVLEGEHIEDFVEKDDLVWANWYYPIQNPKGGTTGAVCTSFNITKHWKHIHQQEAVLKIAVLMRKVNTRAEMIPVICENVAEVLNADATALVTRRIVDGQPSVEYANGIWASANDESNFLGDPAGLQKITQRIVESRQPYFRNDWSYSSGSGERCSIASIPFVAQGESQGALWVCRKTPITDDEVDLLGAIGDLAACALYREAHHEKTESRLQRFVTLQAFERAVNKDLDLGVALSVLLDKVVKQLEVDAARIFLCNGKKNSLVYAAGHGIQRINPEEDCLQFGEGLAGRVALRRRPFYTKDLSHPDHSLAHSSRIECDRFTSYCGVPLTFKGKLKGVLEIFHCQSLDMDNGCFDFLNDLAGEIAIAIDSVEQFDRILVSNNDSGVFRAN